MTTLDKINGEALAVPGLRFRAYRSAHRPARFSINAEDERGAVELWSESIPEAAARITGHDTIGGVEIHSRTKMYDSAPEPSVTDCEITGGDCWTDGSSLAYSETFLPLIKQGASEEILRRLAEWHHSSFGEVA